MSSCPSEFFSDEKPFCLFRIDRTRRMVLCGVKEADLQPRPVTEDQTIACGPIMVGRHKAADVQSTRTTCCKNHSLSFHQKILFRFEIVKNGTRTMPLFVQNQFHNRRNSNHMNSIPVSG